MAGTNEERPSLNRLEVLKALQVADREAVTSTVHLTLTGGAFQTGFALWLGAAPVWVGVLGSVPLFAGLAQLFSAWFVEQRSERKRLIAVFAGVARTLWLPILLTPLLPEQFRFTAFFVLLILSSIALNIPTPAFTGWLSDLVPASHRGRYFGRRNMLAGITTMACSIPAAWFLDLAVKRHLFPQAVGFGGLFGVAVISGLLSFVSILRMPEPPKPPAAASNKGGLRAFADFYKAPFADRDFRRLLRFAGLFALAQWFAGPMYVVYALKVLHLDYVWIQILATLTSVVNLSTTPIWGYLSDKYGHRPLLGIAAFGVGFTPICWMFTDPSKPVITWIMLVLLHIIGGLFWAGALLTQFNMVIAHSPEERRSVYIGAVSAVAGVMGGIAPILGGVLVDALHNVSVQLIGWTLGNYQLVFGLNALLRFAALAMLAGVRSPQTASAREVLATLSGTGVGAWRNLRRLQRASSEEVRRDAAQQLRSDRTALAVDELIGALDDPSLHVREEAATALGEIGDLRALDALIAHLDDPATGIVDEAADSLGRLGDPRAVPPLVRVLTEGEKPDRVAAARALGRIGHTDALSALAEVLVNAEEPEELRETCALALGSLGDPDAVPHLLSQLHNAPRTLTICILRALGEVGDARAGEPVLALLQNAEDEAVIAHAAIALAMVGARMSVPSLLTSLSRLESRVARRQVAHAAGTLLGCGDELYALLAGDSVRRDQQIERRLSEVMPETAAAVIDLYLEGRYSEAVRLLPRWGGELTISDALAAANSREAFLLAALLAAQQSTPADDTLPVRQN
jgi:HEAT repeat protein/sugar phosphate permease